MANCHDLMLRKKEILFEQSGLTEADFDVFWKVYYPTRIDQEISPEDEEYWESGIAEDRFSLSSRNCPYCIASKSCESCKYGEVQQICGIESSGYNKAVVIWYKLKIKSKNV